MKKLMLILVLLVGTISNAQKIEMSVQYFNMISFKDSINESKLVQPMFDPHFDSTLVLLNLNLVFDLDSNRLITNVYNSIDKKYEFYSSSEFEIISFTDDIATLSLTDPMLYNFCKIYTNAKKIITYNIESNQIIGIFADTYDEIKLFED